MNGSCGMCHYFVKDPRSAFSETAGTCHRYPPTIAWEANERNGQWVQQWPWLEKNEVCGEFKLVQNK